MCTELVDSNGDTIDFMLSPNRDLTAAKHFLPLALSRVDRLPQVINVDGHSAYASAIAEVKRSRKSQWKLYSSILKLLIELGSDQEELMAVRAILGPPLEVIEDQLRKDLAAEILPPEGYESGSEGGIEDAEH